MRPWVIRVLDREWRSADQRAQTLIAVADEYGPADQWQAVSPWNGPVALAAWLTVLFTGETANVAAARLLVHTMAAEEFLGCLSEPDDDPPSARVPAAEPPPAPSPLAGQAVPV